MLEKYLVFFQVFPLYEAVSMGDPMQSFTFITLEAFLLILFTKAPSYLTHVEGDLRKKLADFIRKSLVVMISFLQVKQPAISTSGHQASSPESLQNFLAHMAPSAAQNGFDFSQISGKLSTAQPNLCLPSSRSTMRILGCTRNIPNSNIFVSNYYY